MIVEIGVKPTRINKANSYRWFTDEHFSVSTGISSYYFIQGPFQIVDPNNK